MAILSFGCSEGRTLTATSEPPKATATSTVPPAPSETPLSPVTMPELSKTAGPVTSAGLFVETGSTIEPTRAPHIARSRIVKINYSVLFNESGVARKLENLGEITINLFPDITYTGVIEQIEREGDGYTWYGYLRDIEFGGLTMVYTGEVFIGQFASPEGVYEVASIGGDLYQIVLIDQAELQGIGE